MQKDFHACYGVIFLKDTSHIKDAFAVMNKGCSAKIPNACLKLSYSYYLHENPKNNKIARELLEKLCKDKMKEACDNFPLMFPEQ